MTLPAPILIYFTARAPQDAEAFAAAFASDAIVRDEGRTHRGPGQIRDWWLAAKAKYRYRAEPLDWSVEGAVTRVTARVTGDFPGSPAELGFAFELAGDPIVALEIG